MARPRPRSTPAQASRRLIAGSPEAVSDDNFRSQFDTLGQAEGYLHETGLDRTPELFAIVTVPVRRESARRWSPRRPGLDSLSVPQANRYRASRVAQAQAQAHGVDIETWYRVAPNLRAFRGHAPELARQEGESEDAYQDRLIIADGVDFAVYIQREYEGRLSSGRKGWLTRRTREAGARRRAA